MLISVDGCSLPSTVSLIAPVEFANMPEWVGIIEAKPLRYEAFTQKADSVCYLILTWSLCYSLLSLSDSAKFHSISDAFPFDDLAIWTLHPSMLLEIQTKTRDRQAESRREESVLRIYQDRFMCSLDRN